jgi:hypothetical protein
MRVRPTAGWLVLAIVLASGVASADALRCASTIESESARYVQAVVKALGRCEDQRVTGALPAGTNCATTQTTMALIAKADAHLRAHIGSACGGSDRTCGTPDDVPLAATGWNVGTCPGFRAGSCNGAVSDCGGIATCVECVGTAAARQAMGLAYDDLASSEFGRGTPLNGCQRRIGKETARFFRATAKAIGRCWSARLRGAHANDCPTPGDGKAAQVIAAAEARKVAHICASCGGADGCGGSGDFSPSQIGFAATCPDVTAPGGAACAASVDALTPLVGCVDCVSDFDAACAVRVAVPSVGPYPALCQTTTTTTTTSTTSATTTTTATPCPPEPPVPLGSVTVVVRPGTTDCGDVGLQPGPVAPFSGEVDFLDGSKRADLGLACLYTGDGNAQTPPFALPDGAHTVLDVAGVSGLAFTVTASNGTGPADCTHGAGPGRHCLNGAAGNDSQGTCTSDADCNGIAGACDLDANCYFLNPIPVPISGLSACVVNAVASDVCGSANLATNQFALNVNVSSRIYINVQKNVTPCPQCIGGVCTGGARAGLSCSGGVGSKLTTVECPPSSHEFVGRQAINFSGLTSGTATVSAPNGLFCPGQIAPGAFGGEAGTLVEMGSPLFTGGPGLFDTTFAGILCVPSTGSSLFDGVGGLPGPAAVSVPVTVMIDLPLLGLPLP